MPNQYVNEVVYNGQTLMSLTGDTVSPKKVLAGETFHDRSGAQQTGSMITNDVYDGLDSTSADDALSANMGKVLSDAISSLITVEKRRITNSESIAANAVKKFEIPISKNGYLAVGILTITGSRTTGLLLQEFSSGDSVTAQIYMRNVTSSPITPSFIEIRVLYIKE